VGGRLPRRDWLGMIREYVEREKQLRQRLDQRDRRILDIQERHKGEVHRLEDIIDAQRILIERLLAEKHQSNS